MSTTTHLLRSSLLAAAALFAAAVAQAAPAPDLDAVVSYETRQVLASGVTRVETWQERMVRRGDRVWTERLVPAAGEQAHQHEAKEEHAGHKHFNFESAARLVQRDAQGKLQLRYVDREHRVVVDVPSPEYGAVGFDGRWDAAAYLVPPALVEQMRAEPVAAGAAAWRVQKLQGWTHRVQWSDAKQVALRIESRRDDGSFRRVVTTRVTPAAASGLPWNGLESYTRHDYDDFMD